MGSCPGSGRLELPPGPPSSFLGGPGSPHLFWFQPGWRWLLSGLLGDCSMGSWRGLPRPRQTLLLPQKPWLSLSPGRPSERGLYKGLQPCPVLGRLLAGDSEPGQPGAAAAGERHPVCESWSGKQPGAQGWRRHSGGGWQSSHGPSCPRVARPAMQASILQGEERAEFVRHCPKQLPECTEMRAGAAPAPGPALEPLRSHPASA